MCEKDASNKLTEAIACWTHDPTPKTMSDLTDAIDDLQAACQEPPSALTEKVAAMESLPWTVNQRDELRRLLRRMSQDLAVIQRNIQRCEYRDAAADAILDVTIEILHAMVRGWLLLVSEKGGK